MARTVAKEEERTAERKVEDRSDKHKKVIQGGGRKLINTIVHAKHNKEGFLVNDLN